MFDLNCQICTGHPKNETDKEDADKKHSEESSVAPKPDDQKAHVLFSKPSEKITSDDDNYFKEPSTEFKDRKSPNYAITAETPDYAVTSETPDYAVTSKTPDYAVTSKTPDYAIATRVSGFPTNSSNQMDTENVEEKNDNNSTSPHNDFEIGKINDLNFGPGMLTTIQHSPTVSESIPGSTHCTPVLDTIHSTMQHTSTQLELRDSTQHTITQQTNTQHITTTHKDSQNSEAVLENLQYSKVKAAVDTIRYVFSPLTNNNNKYLYIAFL